MSNIAPRGRHQSVLSLVALSTTWPPDGTAMTDERIFTSADATDHSRWHAADAPDRGVRAWFNGIEDIRRPPLALKKRLNTIFLMRN